MKKRREEMFNEVARKVAEKREKALKEDKKKKGGTENGERTKP